MSDTISNLVIVFPILILSLTIHEASHAFAAYMLGDDTAKRAGRLTLDPIRHLDLLGTLMIVYTIVNGFGIGWAKPVPVNFAVLKPRRLGGALVGLAGPFSNVVFGLVFAFLLKLSLDGTLPEAMIRPFLQGAVVNVALASFNLLPLPPLDGSKVVAAALSEKARASYYSVERYGFILVIVLLITGLLWPILRPVMSVLGSFVMSVPGISWEALMG